jgi:probable HAF family extracellular repeat protein
LPVESQSGLADTTLPGSSWTLSRGPILKVSALLIKIGIFSSAFVDKKLEHKIAIRLASTVMKLMPPRTTIYTAGTCLLLTALLQAAPPSKPTKYDFETINPFSSVETSARGINDKGDVVGDFATAADEALLDQKEHGFLRHEGKFKKIDFPNSYDTDANGINNRGVIVGTYGAKLLSGLQGNDHGYVLDERGYHKLPDAPGNVNADWNAINDSGDIVGVMTTVNGNRGFLLRDGVYTTIDSGASFTEANGINNKGDIVGESNDGTEHGFLLHRGVFTKIDFPGADGTVANGINEDGDIVGTYTDANGVDHGFIVKDFLQNPKWQTVDFPGSTDTTLAGINEDGDLVGTAALNNQNKGFEAEKDKEHHR